MTTALVLEGSPPGGIDLAADLAAVGIQVLGATTQATLVRDAALHGPDVVVCHDVSPDAALFAACTLLAETAPCPAIVFTHDPEAAKIEQALRAGIQAYVVNGYGVHRLRAVIHVAQARFAHEQAFKAEFADVSRRFDERKLVDRAKGILMRARQVSEEEAFAVLRAASMHSNRRVGQVSRQVIAAAHYADAVNRAGKLRMLSQRLVAACALAVFDPGGSRQAERLDDCVAQIDANIATLAKSLSRPTFGDLLDTVAAAWAGLQSVLARPGSVERLAELDALAEQLLLQADQLTRQLETAGLVTTLHVLNVSGRQRMLSQRHAKQALLGLLPDAAAASAARADLVGTAATFETAMAHLKSVPLSTAAIRTLLADADGAWADAVQAAQQARRGAGARELVASSDRLLAIFEQLTDLYERSMQVLMG